MSQDHKPRAIKAVTVAGAAPVDEQLDAAENTRADTIISGQDDTGTQSKSAFPVVPALVFLLACALGGAGITALPHFMSDFAERLYGERK